MTKPRRRADAAASGGGAAAAEGADGFGKVWAIVAHYGAAAATDVCLATLVADGVRPERCVVVDNQGGFENAQQVVLRPAGNVGFAGAAGLGARYALEQGADWLWFVNNDADVEPGCLAALLEAAAAEPRAGLLSPVILYRDGDEAWFAGGEVDRRTMAARHLTTIPAPNGTPAPYDTGYITGCAMLARAAAAQSRGLPREDLFMYVEDVEWSLRLADAGWRLLVVPAARVRHGVERRGRRRVFSARAVYYVTRNRVLVAGDRGRSLAALGPAGAWAARQIVKGASLDETKRASLAACAGLWHGLRGCSGRLAPRLEERLG